MWFQWLFRSPKLLMPGALLSHKSESLLFINISPSDDFFHLFLVQYWIAIYINCDIDFLISAVSIRGRARRDCTPNERSFSRFMTYFISHTAFIIYMSASEERDFVPLCVSQLFPIPYKYNNTLWPWRRLTSKGRFCISLTCAIVVRVEITQII